MKKVIIFFIILFALLLVFFLYFTIYQKNLITTSTRASINEISVQNSYVFASPVRAKANNQEKIRITVFILNERGLGVANKKVTLTVLPNLSLEAVQSLTDNSGKALFDLSSSAAGDYYLDVKVDGRKIEQRAHLTFD